MARPVNENPVGGPLGSGQLKKPHTTRLRSAEILPVRTLTAHSPARTPHFCVVYAILLSRWQLEHLLAPFLTVRRFSEDLQLPLC